MCDLDEAGREGDACRLRWQRLALRDERQWLHRRTEGTAGDTHARALGRCHAVRGEREGEREDEDSKVVNIEVAISEIELK